MKKFNPLLIVAFVLMASFAEAQTLPALDASPADIAYFRPNGRNSFPVIIKVTYGRPLKKGRTMLGGIEPFGKVWRLGANEATEIKLYQDTKFGDKVVKAGTYSLFAIPEANEWTIIFNSDLDTWGAFSYKEAKDVARIKVPTGKTEAPVEAFSIAFAGTAGKGDMIMAWEETMVKVPFTY
jgi:hypothetical protein